MSTILSTSRYQQIPYTVIGGKKQDKIARYPEKFTLLILNRQSRIYKQEMFNELEALGFGEILSIESSRSSYDLETLARRFPMVRFLQFHNQDDPDDLSGIGEKINIGFEEALGRFVCVIWNDLRFHRTMNLSRVFEEVQASPGLCRVPHLQDPKGEDIPCLLGPAFYKNTLKIVPVEPGHKPAHSIFPFDYTGFYDKEKFLLSGGFDALIPNPYWQILDFGFRNYMWGEEILSLPSFTLNYSHEPPAMDMSVGDGYERFFLKNLSVRFHGDCGAVSRWKFFSFLAKSGLDFFHALEEFRSVRDWVYENRYRFVQDAVSVTDLWRVE